MTLEFEGEIWHWRGPSPYHFVSVPPEECVLLDEVAPMVSYGWGMVPVTVRMGSSEWTTSLWPRNGGYIVPLKDAVRKPEGLAVGDVVRVRLTVAV